MNVEDYLKRFGYLRQGITSLADAISIFKRVWGIHPDADQEVAEAVMRLPRCGLPDHTLTTGESRWRKTALTVYVESYVTALPTTVQDELLDACLKAWPAVANVTMSRTSSRAGADVVIGAGRGPSAGFDGPQGVLAWAELPQGDDRQLHLMLDLDERWIRDGTQAGILYKNVVDHELGHILGLDHSGVQTALMAPYYAAGISIPQQNDDIPRIQGLYGVPTAPPSASTRIVLDFQGTIPAFTVRRE